MENSAACLLEAQELIDGWLRDELRYDSGDAPHGAMAAQKRAKSTKCSHYKRASRKNMDSPNNDLLKWNGDLENADYITGMDFVDTDISQCVKQVMAGMYTQPLEHDVLKVIEGQQTVTNPAVTMEMRHKQVKSRRQHRQHHRSVLLEARAAEKESRLAAERMVKSEKEAVMMKQRQDEALVKLEMVKIRKRLKEKQEREKLLRELDGTLGSSNAVIDDEQSPADVVMSTAQHVMDEEMRHRVIAETRRVLVKQLADAETMEMKENNKLLRRCFNAWLDTMNNSKMLHERAYALWVWQTKCRVFQSWRKVVDHNKRQQELATLALHLQWEKRCSEMASLHYNHLLVTKVFTSWKRWSRGCQEARLKERTKQQQDDKMAALLARVTAVRLRDTPTSMKSSDQCDPTTVHQNHSFSHHHTSPPISKEHHSVNQDSPCLQHQPVCHRDSCTVEKEYHKVPSLITSRLVREELEKLLAEKRVTSIQDHVILDHVSPIKAVVSAPVVATPAAANTSGATNRLERERDRILRTPSVTIKSHSTSSLHDVQHDHKMSAVAKQLPTKPIRMLGMEQRARKMAERRQAREQRLKEREEQILAAKEREQQEKEATALAAKEASLKKKKEERQLAKQKEREKQQHLLEVQHKTGIANEHYNNWLLRYRGVLPWKHFVAKIHEDNDIANQFYVRYVYKATLSTWQQHFEARCEQRNMKADKFYITMVTKRMLALWEKYVHDMKYAGNHANQWYRWMLVKKHFKSWHGYVRQQEVKMWEKERRAKVHYNWNWKRKVLLSWHQFIPVAKEDRLREQRRDELRKKVCRWLPDYQTALNCED